VIGSPLVRRSTFAFAVVLAAISADVAACNTISGVGDFTFTSGSAATGSGGGAATSTAGGAAGASSMSGGGGSGGAVLEVACPKMKCVVTPGERACCYDNPTEHGTASGRCVDKPIGKDGCVTDSSDGGRETRIECSTPADCDGGACCATYGGMDPDAGGAWYSLVACKDKCGAEDITLCDPMVQGACTDHNATCGPSDILPSGYFVCP
jgi:predicted small secreted protein